MWCLMSGKLSQPRPFWEGSLSLNLEFLLLEAEVCLMRGEFGGQGTASPKSQGCTWLASVLMTASAPF